MLISPFFCFQHLPSTKNVDTEAVSITTEEFKAESPTKDDNRLLAMTRRALEAAERSKMNGDQDWVSHLVFNFGIGQFIVEEVEKSLNTHF